MSVAYASTLLQRGMGVQDVAILSGMKPDILRTLRRPSMRRTEYSYYPLGSAYGPPMPTRGQQIQATIHGIALRYGVRVRDIIGHERAFVEARQAAMYAVWSKWGLSYPHVGQIMKRHHTTIMWGVKRHKARLAAEGRV